MMVEEKRWLVQKFGGTSVGKFPLDIANSIVKVYTETNRVIVVCSARSTDTKSEGTTTRLLEAAEKALSDEDYMEKIEAIRSDHLAAARKDIKSKELLRDLEENINKECDLVINIIGAAQIIEEVSSRTLDAILATGEKLSCLYMAAVISDNGVPAAYVDLSHVITSSVVTSPDNGTDLGQEFYESLGRDIGGKIKEIMTGQGHVVPVVTGFFGSVPGGIIDSVGRGYTDFCAALIAVAFKAAELQIWKEVDGIFTADPRKVPTARQISIITPEEAAELTYYGSEVIHPFTMEQVIRARIPIRIKNVMNPAGDGTVVFPGDPDNVPDTPRQSFNDLAGSYFAHINAGGPTAVTVKKEITVLNIHSNRRNLSYGFLAKVFSTLHKWKIVVDLISTSEVHVSMALQQSSFAHGHFQLALSDLRQYGTVDVVARQLCIVSLVGTQMKQSVGTAGTMFQALADAEINIEMISQGASEINISAVIAEKDAIKALNVLHQKLLSNLKKPSLLNMASMNNSVPTTVGGSSSNGVSGPRGTALFSLGSITKR